MSDVAGIPVSKILQLLLDKVDAMHCELVEMKRRVNGQLVNQTDALMTTAEVKDVLNYETEETVRRLHRSKGKNHLPAVRDMRPLRFRRDIVMRYKIGKRGRDLYGDE